MRRRAELRPATRSSRELGRGGMGVVYGPPGRAQPAGRAQVIRIGGFASEAELLRFQNEAEAVAQLDHPHIVPIYEVGSHGGRHFFSMKLIAGTSLDKRLAEFAADPRAAARLVADRRRGDPPRPPARHPPPRPEAGQHPAGRDGRAARHRLRPGQADRRRRRADAFERPDRDAVVHGAGAGDPGRGRALDGDGRLRPGDDPLRPAHRPGAVRRHDAGRDARHGADASTPSRRRGSIPGCPRDLEVICRKCLEKEPRRRYPERPGPGRGPVPLAAGRADPGAAGRACDRARGDVVPPQPAAGRRRRRLAVAGRRRRVSRA